MQSVADTQARQASLAERINCIETQLARYAAEFAVMKNCHVQEEANVRELLTTHFDSRKAALPAECTDAKMQSETLPTVGATVLASPPSGQCEPPPSQGVNALPAAAWAVKAQTSP